MAASNGRVPEKRDGTDVPEPPAPPLKLLIWFDGKVTVALEYRIGLLVSD